MNTTSVTNRTTTVKAAMLLVGIFLLATPPDSRAWGPIAHYLITRHNHGEAIARYANLPDAWESRTEPDYGLTVDITPYFCWSHGVRNTGVIDLPNSMIEVPRKPVYHPAFPAYEPGAVMVALLNGKVNLAQRWTDYNPPDDGPTIASHLANASLGFALHNEEDSPVHWDYFLGATGNEASNSESQDKWSIHHGLKEAWADYVLLATQVFHKRELERTDFDLKGHIVLPSGYSPSMLAIDWRDEHNCYDNYLVESLAWLLRLAQAAYNKNRTSRSTIDTSKYGLPVQSLAKIENLLKTQDAKLRQYFSLSHWATWEITI